MARTTAELVKGVLFLEYDSRRQPDLSPFIATASAIVDRCAAQARLRNRTVSDAALADLETWIAAWAYKQSDPCYTSKSTGGASGSFMGQSGKGFDSNRFGTTALAVDPTGCLAGLGRLAGGFWLGKSEAESLSYADRNP